jgi:4-hydroxyphenylpyruvate dioxygenase-like putative hemolysin
MLHPVPETSPRDTTFKKIDHIAIAVRDLEAGIAYFSEVLGFQLVRRRKISGGSTGMVSAEMEHHGIKFVLCQGTEPASQVSRLIEHAGPGVAHIALEVADAGKAENALRERGMRFDTALIRGPGLNQIFSSRDPNTGLSFEFIERNGEQDFLEENIQDLFQQLERSGAY